MTNKLSRLMPYIQHDNNCKIAQAYPTQGRPTENGYEQMIFGEWHQVSPIDKSPKFKCTCGLDNILKQIKS